MQRRGICSLRIAENCAPKYWQSIGKQSASNRQAIVEPVNRPPLLVFSVCTCRKSTFFRQVGDQSIHSARTISNAFRDVDPAPPLLLLPGMPLSRIHSPSSSLYAVVKRAPFSVRKTYQINHSARTISNALEIGNCLPFRLRYASEPGSISLGFYVHQDIVIKVKTRSRLRGREPTSCELRESAGSSSGPYREDEGGRHILKTKGTLTWIPAQWHTGKTRRTAYRDDGDSVLAAFGRTTAKRRQILRSVLLEGRILRSLEAANSPTLALVPSQLFDYCLSIV